MAVEINRDSNLPSPDTAEGLSSRTELTDISPSSDMHRDEFRPKTNSSSIYKREYVELGEWNDALDVAKGLIESSPPFIVKPGSNGEIMMEVAEGQGIQAAEPYLIFVGEKQRSNPTSRNYREVAMLHELGHYKVNRRLAILSQVIVGIPLLLWHKFNLQSSERAANRIVFQALSSTFGTEVAKERMLESHRENLQIGNSKEISPEQLVAYCEKYSPWLLGEELKRHSQ